MTKILFVCHGNICRSPMAQYIMQELANRQHIADQLLLASAGTSAEELGNPIYRRAVDTLVKYNIPFQPHAAVQMQRSDYERYDYLIGMDKWNISNMLRELGGDKQRKVMRLLDFSDIPRDVADPWRTRKFDVAYEDILEGCVYLLRHLISTGEITQKETDAERQGSGQ